jgi:REP element-mobilizing transposase RayT
MTPPHAELNDDLKVLAYFITFRTYGTWLHGDARGSVDRFHNRYGTPYLAPNRLREEYMRSRLKRPPVRLTRKQRKVVEESMWETCKTRKWILWATNARTNHVHSVVTADCGSKKARSILKAGATKRMREKGCWTSDRSPWADRGSRRKVYTQRGLMAVIDYVLYDQGQ